MQIVIDLSEYHYKRIVKGGISVFGSDADIAMLENALRSGTPLPKGHGRLIDADELINDFKMSRAMSVYERLKAACIVNHAYDKKCLVEADKEGAEE